MPRAIFVTGTDTGVGKTYVSCGVARAFRVSGLDVGVVKPFASGSKRGSHGDVEALIAASGSTDPFEDICPCLFRDPLAPSVAAKRERRAVDVAKAAAAVRRVAARHDVTIVEGAGGLLVPVTDRMTVADFAKRLGLPLLIVARPALGTLNHTKLTVEAARARRIPVLGIVVSFATPHHGLAERTNLAILAKHAGAPLLAAIPHGGGKREFAALARAMGRGRAR